MASPFKIAIGVNIDAAGAKTGAGEAKQAVASIGTAAEQTASQLQKLIAASTGIHDGPSNQNLRQWNGLLAEQGSQLDSLRSKYNPLFATIQKYKETQQEIRAAHAMGALSADEYTAAMARERQAALASMDAIKGRNTALSAGSGNQKFQAGNLAFQLQDIATTAPFMPWYTVALQQGPQVASVLGSMENKAAGVAAAFASILNPVSLASVALVGAGAAAIQYFSSVSNEAEVAQAALDKQKDTILEVTRRWGDALPALRAYAQEQERLSQGTQLKDASTSAANSQWTKLRSDITALNIDFADLMVTVSAGGVEIGKAQQDFNRLRKGIADGTATAQDAKTVQAELLSLFKTEGVPILNTFASRFTSLADEIARASGKARDLKQEAATLSLDELIKQRVGPENLPQIDPLGFLDTMRAQNSKADATKSLYQKEQEKLAKGNVSTANAYRDLVKSAHDRVEQMKLEAQLAGETGIAADTLRFRLDLLQQSKEKGRSVSAKQLEDIDKEVAAYKKWAEAAATAKLKADLLFDRQQLGRSTFDQQIAVGLRGAGLEVDFDSYEAGLIRTNLQLQYARDLTGDFASTMFESLRNGEGFWDSLGDAGVNALKRISDTLLNDVLNSLFRVQGAAGGGSGGGLLGGILSLFGGGGSSSVFPAKPGGLYYGGGYTGPGGLYEPRGVVHAGEVVWSQHDIARAGGVATVEAMRLGRQGYAEGGVVDVVPLMGESARGRLYQTREGSAEAVAARAAADPVRISVDVSGARGNQEIMEMVHKGVQSGIQEYDSYYIPDRFAALSREPWRR